MFIGLVSVKSIFRVVEYNFINKWQKDGKEEGREECRGEVILRLYTMFAVS